jgi:hypothetical protein
MPLGIEVPDDPVFPILATTSSTDSRSHRPEFFMRPPAGFTETVRLGVAKLGINGVGGA